MKITDTMVLAILKKGFNYEAKNVDVDFETEVPLEAFGVEESNSRMVMKVTCKVESLTMKINEESNEF